MKKRNFTRRVVSVLLLSAGLALHGCRFGGAAKTEEEPLADAVGRLVRPDAFSAERAAAYLTRSLREYRAGLDCDGPLAVRVCLRTDCPRGCTEAERARARRLAEKLFRHKDEFLTAGGMTESDAAEGTPVELRIGLDAVPGQGNFLEAELTGGGLPPWREALELADWE